MTAPAVPEGRALVVGLGVTGRAVSGALAARGFDVVAVDDRPTTAVQAEAARLGVELQPAPSDTTLAALVASSAMVLPSPGVPDRHPVFALAAGAGVPVLSEFDLARAWDHRPLLAVTGTDGKTTVVTLVDAMLRASGLVARIAGNTEVPLVAAIDEQDVEVFVVEASSFRLAHTRSFTPSVATWLNFAADHQDCHSSLDAYERAKARIWSDQSSADVAVGNADDPVVARWLADAPARRVTFGSSADYQLAGGLLTTPAGALLAEEELPRRLPHDIVNSLAAAATALEGEVHATVDGVVTALRSQRPLHHRIELVGEAEGVRYFDDSKSTAPHATLAALRAFPSVVLIAGGRNKGLDLSPLADESDRIRAVVAIGEAAGEVADVFSGRRPVEVATSMGDAVGRAAAVARAGDVVLLSPACASFDWYGSDAERGDDFASEVAELLSSASRSRP